MPTLIHKKKDLGMRVSKFSDPLGIVNTCFLLRTFFVTNVEYLDILLISSVYKIYIMQKFISKYHIKVKRKTAFQHLSFSCLILKSKNTRRKISMQT